MSGDSKGFATSCWERGGMIICYFPSREKGIEFFLARSILLCVDGDGGDWCWLFDVKFLINADCRLQRLVREGWTLRRGERGDSETREQRVERCWHGLATILLPPFQHLIIFEF